MRSNGFLVAHLWLEPSPLRMNGCGTSRTRDALVHAQSRLLLLHGRLVIGVDAIPDGFLRRRHRHRLALRLHILGGSWFRSVLPLVAQVNDRVAVLRLVHVNVRDVHRRRPDDEHHDSLGHDLTELLPGVVILVQLNLTHPLTAAPHLVHRRVGCRRIEGGPRLEDLRGAGRRVPGVTLIQTLKLKDVRPPQRAPVMH